MNPSYREHNAAATRQLCAFVQRLAPADLDRPLGDGWTVKAALAHLAFWDRFAALLLQEWQGAGVRPTLEQGEDRYLNQVCLRDWLALPPAYARREVLEAAALADGHAAQVTEQLRADIFAIGESWALLRYRHRSEHLAQIREAPSSPA